MSIRRHRIWRGSVVLFFTIATILLPLWNEKVESSVLRTSRIIYHSLVVGRAHQVQLVLPWSQSFSAGQEAFAPGTLLTRIDPDNGEEHVVGEVVGIEPGEVSGSLRLRISILPERWGELSESVIVDCVYPPRDEREALGFVFDSQFVDRFEKRLTSDFRDLFERRLRRQAMERLEALLEELMPPEREIEEFLKRDVVPEVRKRFDEPMNEVQRLIITRLKKTFGFWGRTKLLYNILWADDETLRKKLMPVIRKAVEDYWAENRTELVRRARRLAEHYRPQALRYTEEVFAPAFLDDVLRPLYERNTTAFADLIEENLRWALDEKVFRTNEEGERSYRPRFVYLVRALFLRKEEVKLFFEPAPGEPIEQNEELPVRCHFLPGTPAGSVTEPEGEGS